MTGIKTDGEMLKALGISETEAAAKISMSRQNLNVALKRSAHYFKFHDLLALRNYCVSRQNPRLQEFDEYIIASRGRGVLEDIIGLQYPGVLTASETERAKEIWAVLPYVRYFRVTYRDPFDRIVDAAKRNPAALTVFVESEQEADDFRRTSNLAPEDQPTIKIFPRACPLPYTIILDPYAAVPRGWILTESRLFQQIDNLRADGMVDFIKQELGLAKPKKRLAAGPSANP